jgi:hypothetical protein
MNSDSMFNAGRIAVWFLAAGMASAAGICQAIAGPTLNVEQIVANNVKARGGLEAWRGIQTMTTVGHLETGNPSMPEVPFVMQQARPNKTRFEVHVREKTSVRIFNGVDGWKLRPGRGGIPDVLDYTADEIEAARNGPGIDGPLVDYRAKGISVNFDGMDEIAGKKAYRLILKLPSGATRRWWIDAKSFLDLSYERESHTAAGRSAVVTVSFGDYKSIDGLQIPQSITTSQVGAQGSESMVIEKVLLNQRMDDQVFSRPFVPKRRQSGISQ